MYKGGYTGKILRINLTDQSAKTEDLPAEMAQPFLGGAQAWSGTGENMPNSWLMSLQIILSRRNRIKKNTMLQRRRYNRSLNVA